MQDELIIPVNNPENTVNPTFSANVAAFQALINHPDSAWLKEILENSPLPSKYNWRSIRHNGKILFSSYSTVAVCYMFYQAGMKQSYLAATGIVFENSIQCFFFCILVADLLLSLKNNKTLAAVSGVTGTFATVSNAIAAFYLSEVSENPWLASHAWLAALFNASGNFSQNMCGIFGNLKQIQKFWNRSPTATRYTIDKMRETFKDNAYLNTAIRPERGAWNLRIANTLAAGTGMTLMFNQMGYVCASGDFFAEHTNKISGIVLGILTNLPNIAMTLGFSGPSLARTIVNMIFDLCQSAANCLAGKSGNKLSARERRYQLVNATLIIASCYLATHSSASSTYFYEDKCPDRVKNLFLAINVDQGAQLFNGVNTAIAINTALIWAKTAYAPLHADEHTKFLIEGMVKKIETLPKNEIEPLAEKLGWKKPSPAEGRRSCLSRFFHRSNAAQEDYQAMANNNENRNTNRGMCVLM